MGKVKIKGVVGRGKALGRRLGYPTANIYGVGGLEAADGVYAVSARVEGMNDTLHGMANLGRRPTVDADGEQRVLEVHFFDYRGDLYGRRVEIELCRYMRPEQAFADIEALGEQLGRDEVAIREFFSERNK